MYNLVAEIQKLPIVARMFDFLDNKKMNKQGVSIYQVLRIFIGNYKEHQLVDRAGGVAFNFTLAIFPAIIFFFTLIPYMNIPDLTTENIMYFLNEYLPASLYQAVASTIEDILNKPRGGLLSFGVLFSLYLATNGMMALIRAFNRIYSTDEHRGFFRTRLIATALTVVLSFALFLSVILLFVGQIVLKLIIEYSFITEDYWIYMIVVLRFFVVFILFLLVISTIYYFAPMARHGWGFISPGSILSTFLCISVSYVFSFYISNFGTYNKLYGSIGAMIAFMIWLLIFAFILLVGFEFNNSIEMAGKENKRARELEKGKGIQVQKIKSIDRDDEHFST